MPKLRQILAVFVAPFPVVILFFLFALEVHALPVEVIDGAIDNAPHRAASLLLFFIPFLFYPVLVILIALQILVVRWMCGFRLKSQLVASFAISAVVSSVLARAIYAPQFGESYLRAWFISFLVLSAIAIMTTLTWWVVAIWSPSHRSTPLTQFGLAGKGGS